MNPKYSKHPSPLKEGWQSIAAVKCHKAAASCATRVSCSAPGAWDQCSLSQLDFNKEIWNPMQPQGKNTQMTDAYSCTDTNASKIEYCYSWNSIVVVSRLSL